MTDELRDDMKDALEECFDAWGLTIEGEISSTKLEDEYEVAVPFGGELLYDEHLQDGQGNLLYVRDIEILFKGVRDGKMLLTVKDH